MIAFLGLYTGFLDFCCFNHGTVKIKCGVMAQDVRDAFGPCEVMCKCFGLLPVYFRAELTFHQKVTNCLHLVAIYGLLAWSTGICMPRDMVNYSLSMVMNRSVVLLIVAYYVQPFCNTLAQIGTRMHNDHQRKFIRFFTNLTTAPLCVIFMTTYYLNTDMSDLCYLLASIYFSLHHVIVCSLAGTLGWLLHKRFRALAATLQSFVLVIVMNYVHPFLCTVLCAAMSGKINLILVTIEAIDSKLKALNTEVNFEMYRRFAVFLVHVSTIPIFLLLVIYWAVARATDIIYVFAATFISFHYFVVVSLDVILVGVLSKQFRAIGEALRSTAGTLGWFTCKRLQALSDTMLRMYFPTSPTSGGFLTTTAPGHTAETAVCSEKEQLTVLRQIKILHDKLNDVVELVNYCFSVQITFCVGLCFVIGVVCSFGLFRAFIYRNELFYMGVLNFIWYMYYLFFVLFFIAVGSKITREVSVYPFSVQSC
ncbi:Gustatory receptor 28b [Culex quinquefasciatus]|uniref:Gustatory receptor n=1 Tax=Culex quinquefasciatus TaxID=7176 RepID=B0XFH0_CULQU|nr:Gustatory receptor 28b [Culex quinquefasciatus]|eukprot:XP_001868392.1 Gustatory receptor 28b [Culex quinquefasciatus]